MRLLAPLVLLGALAVAGCGAGPQITQTRDVAPFSSIEVSSSIDVDVVPGDASTVRVRAGEHIIDHVNTSSSDGVLHVSIRDHGIVIGPDPYDDAHIEVSSGALQGVRIEGSSDVALGRLDADELSIDISGSGDVEAAGAVGNLIASIEGSGDADLRNLVARTGTVSIQGSGDAKVNVKDKLDVSVQGSGDVTYRGNPRISQSVAGSGDIHAED
jgi:Putative auto-transporter adhesin, head GIN domain